MLDKKNIVAENPEFLAKQEVIFVIFITWADLFILIDLYDYNTCYSI